TSRRAMTQATEAGMVMGTAGYMSPEQVRGAAVDPRSDIFSFGAILYEMISGKRAFHRETAADTMSAILKEDPADLSETNRNVSPALERIVQHCLEKNPEQRFHSASDIAFDLEHLTGISGTSTRVTAVASARPRSRLLLPIAGVAAIALAMLALGWWLGRGSGASPQAEYKQITFRTGSMGNARFTPDGGILYSASWDGGDDQLYLFRTDDPGAREVLDNVQDADWSASGDSMAVVRYVPENSHWRLEYPIGKVLFDSIGWISDPKISPDGKWVAFADHENQGGDDEGSVAIIGADGKEKEKKLSSGWESVEGVLWSPTGDEIWFTSSDSGSALNPRAVTLSG